MSIFNYFISVTVKKDYITISGVNPKPLSKVFSFNLGDGRFFNSVFERHFRSVTFHKFYLADVYYILNSASTTAFPSYKSVLLKIIKELDVSTWTKDINTDLTKGLNYNRIKDFNYTPLDFQQEFLEYYDTKVLKYQLNGALLAATPGSGKTFTTLLLSQMLESDRVIVICPLNAIRKAWERELNVGFKHTPSYYLSVNSNRYTNETVAIYHYEALEKLSEDMDTIRKGGKITIILDESHNFNNPSSKRSLFLLDVIRRSGSRDILFASGTPVKAIGNELTVLFKAIDPSFDDSLIKGFNKLFNKGSSHGNLKILNAKIGRLSFKVDKSRIKLAEPNIVEVKIPLKNGERYTLPVIREKMDRFIEERLSYYKEGELGYRATFDTIIDTYERVLVNMNNEEGLFALKEYLSNVKKLKAANDRGKISSFTHKDMMMSANGYEKEVLFEQLPTDDVKTLKGVLTLVKYPLLKVRGEALGTVLTRERISCFKDLASNINIPSIVDEAMKKTVIFSSYVEVCEHISTMLKGNGYTTADVYGKFTKNLDKQVANFNTKDTVNPIIATFDSLSTAVPLTIANVVIFINVPYRDSIRMQALSRVHRIGADTPIFIYDVELATELPNLSTRGLDILKWSQEQVEKIMGDIDGDVALECDVVNIDDINTITSTAFSNW